MKYSQISFLMFSVLISFSLIIHYVDGRNKSKAEEDDLEIERQLRVLNKKPVKTMIVIIDCIDIYKQPAFDNPLLMIIKSSSIPGETRSKNISASSIFRGLHTERCPSGTVPIHRTTREDLVNAKYSVKKNEPIGANGYPNVGFHFVYVEEVIPGGKYFGAAASMTIHNLTVDLDQFSTSQIWIVNSSEEETNGIEFGIMTDGHHPTGCYNMLCPGFVQVSRDVFLADQFAHSSTYGQKVYEAHLMVYRAQDTGHWWLRVGPNAEVTEDVGYWPVQLFTHLRTVHHRYDMVGLQVHYLKNQLRLWVNGYFPQLNDHKKTAFMRLLRYVNETGNLVNLDTHSVRTMNTA
ncbi:hypothetical protein MKW98_027301 [Papaver atlanticum]|uniref:Neprosin PEP catalytic domain-containing protein n=1 Tax=Papaver atlanticum TaxID=357466 RepID=A0AAD4XK07_9MAGN|nr:hypothetical protein MKW98_027301 [Papaver atlanticum]